MKTRNYGSFVHALVFGHLRTRLAAIGTQRRSAAALNIFASKIYSSGRAPPWRTRTRLIETTAELGHTLGQIANVHCEDERAGRS